MAASLDDVLSELKNLNVGVKDLNVGFKDLHVGFDELSVGVKDLGVGVKDLGVGFKDLSVGFKDLSVGFKDLSVGVTSALADLRADLTVLSETVIELHAKSVALTQLPEELRLMRESSNAMANAAVRIAGDHEGRLQTVEKILGLR